MPQHQSCCDREGDHQGCCGDRSPQQGLLPNVSIQLFPPGLDEAGLPALLTQQPASAGIFQFEAKAAWNLHSPAAAGTLKGEHRHCPKQASIHQVWTAPIQAS